MAGRTTHTSAVYSAGTAHAYAPVFTHGQQPLPLQPLTLLLLLLVVRVLLPLLLRPLLLLLLLLEMVLSQLRGGTGRRGRRSRVPCYCGSRRRRGRRMPATNRKRGRG